MGRPSNAEIAARSAASDIPSITYIPIHPGDPHETLWNKHRFRSNIPVTPKDVKEGLSAAQMIEAAKGNPWFQVAGYDKAEAIPETPESPEQYRGYAVAWIRLANSAKELSARWRNEAELREECGCGDDDNDYLLTIYNPRYAMLKESEALQRAAVND